ncbi:MAG: riboflavin biosynthesis protein RibF [Gammaproteobacteria bacterium GWE2_37_16]|nr:MAG: riboflavin biosynthesis protein RibF [Gammaproteobacteria bacterium GWE2_37_16]
MHLIIRGLNSLSPFADSCIATIGNFDGVHLGHQQILARLRQSAQAHGLPSTVILFEPQPVEYFQSNEKKLPRLTTLVEKIKILRQVGIDRVLCLRFDERLAKLSADDFIQRVLIANLHIKGLVVGDDFVFGCDKEGGGELLQHGVKHNFSVVVVPAYKVDGVRVGSTGIRNYLEKGDLANATKILGRAYGITGRVVHGDKVGRDLGFPTANIALHHKVLPLAGVYVARVHDLDDKKKHYGVANIGFRPTVGGKKLLLEVYIFDFTENIYQRKITVDFLHKLRDEKKFADFMELKNQIGLDVARAKEFVFDKIRKSFST